MADFMKQIDREVREDRELARLVKQEELILDVTELILEKLEEQKLTKSELASMLGTNKSHVTQLLRGTRNMTLRTISDIFFDLNCEVVFNATSMDEHDNTFVLMESKLRLDEEQPTNWRPDRQSQICANTESTEMAIAA